MERVQATRDHEYDVATYLLVGCIADLFNVMIWLNIQYARSESMMFNVQGECKNNDKIILNFKRIQKREEK